MSQQCSYAWRGPRGSGKRTHLLEFLRKQAEQIDINFEIKYGTWFLDKQKNNADTDEEDDEANGRSIPYEESPIHLGFNVAKMSMSDKVFLQSILTRWTGHQDVCLMNSFIKTRYLVLYHAHFLTDESILQLQECLEQYPTFAILLTTELPICSRLRDFCMEIPVPNTEDLLLKKYVEKENLPKNDVWLEYFKKKINDWSFNWSADNIVSIRNWIYICLQRNLRWTDVIQYWIEAIYETEWIEPEMRQQLLETLSFAESGSGWVLVTSYRIPIVWEHVHLLFGRQLYELRHKSKTAPQVENVKQDVMKYLLEHAKEVNKTKTKYRKAV